MDEASGGNPKAATDSKYSIINKPQAASLGAWEAEASRVYGEAISSALQIPVLIVQMVGGTGAWETIFTSQRGEREYLGEPLLHIKKEALGSHVACLHLLAA